LTHHDTTEDGFHEIQLSAKQLVFLFMVLTVVSVVIFLCGVLVGRSVGPNPQTEQPIASSTPDPGVPPEPSSPAAATGDVPPTPAESSLTYDKRLRGETPQRESVKSQAEPREQSQPPQGEAQKPEPTKTTPAATPPPAAAAVPATAAADDVPTSGKPGTWYLQVIAVKSKPAAADIVRKLIAKGFPAYLENPRSGPQLYRVRVGRYGSRPEAERVAARLQKEAQFKSDIGR
jgi:DedD protein